MPSGGRSYSAHKKAIRELTCEHPEWFEVEWLPCYAPDLNPAEGVWQHSKCVCLANFFAEDVDQLREAGDRSLSDLRSTRNLLRAFFRHAGLEV